MFMCAQVPFVIFIPVFMLARRGFNLFTRQVGDEGVARVVMFQTCRGYRVKICLSALKTDNIVDDLPRRWVEDGIVNHSQRVA